jgi:ubiquinone/menaquinone biosynthesis C-methylase UbiE
MARRLTNVKGRHDVGMRLPRPIRLAIKRLAYGGIGGGREGARVVEWLALRPRMSVADIGSGFGDFAFRFAAAVAPDGAVFAIDTDADLREEVAHRAAARGLAAVHVVAALDDDPTIPRPVDLVFLSASFHHLPDRPRYFERVRPVLRPGGRVAILEARPSRFSDFLGGHATDPAAVRATMETAGFRWLAAEPVGRSTLQTFGIAPVDGAS